MGLDNAKCEICGEKSASMFSISFIVFNEEVEVRCCFFKCNECSLPTNMVYEFEISRMFRNPMATIDWLAHVAQKGFFKNDEFAKMIIRYRKEADCFGRM